MDNWTGTKTDESVTLDELRERFRSDSDRRFATIVYTHGNGYFMHDTAVRVEQLPGDTAESMWERGRVPCRVCGEPPMPHIVAATTDAVAE